MSKKLKVNKVVPIPYEVREAFALETMREIIEECRHHIGITTHPDDMSHYKKLKKACVRVLNYYGVSE